RSRAAGGLETLAGAATPGYLPLLSVNDKAVRAQVRVGVDEYRRYLGRDPLGFWLPECAYYPGLDRILAAERVRYFLVESHGVLYAQPRPINGVFPPIWTPAGVAALGRAIGSSRHVWSS